MVVRRVAATAVAMMALGVMGAVPAGCSDRALDSGLIGSLTEEPRALPETPVRPMTGEDTAYPNLATVPPRPTDIPTVAERQRDMESLEQDRAAARAAAAALERELNPLAVPPPPVVTPGRRSGG